MVRFRQRLVGRRREILNHIQSGTYGDWLIEQAAAQRRDMLAKVSVFRLRWFGNRRDLVDDVDIDISLDSIAPRDLFDSWTTEQRLWGAVLIRAIYDLVHFYLDPKNPKTTHANQSRLGKEAYNWFTSTRTDVGSYRWVCGALNMYSPDAMKEMIFTKKREDLPRQCSSRKKK